MSSSKFSVSTVLFSRLFVSLSDTLKTCCKCCCVGFDRKFSHWIIDSPLWNAKCLREVALRYVVAAGARVSFLVRASLIADFSAGADR